MRERSNRAVSKTVEPLAAPWVRIPLSPRVLLERRGHGKWLALADAQADRAPSRVSVDAGLRTSVDVAPSMGAGRDDRVAEGARLEGVCTRKGTVGSNPTLSVQPLWR
jgi:hypothetical protein